MADSRQQPWVRRLVLLGALVLLLVVILLFVHLLFMGTAHTEDSGCATCLTVLVAGAAALVGIASRSHRNRTPFVFPHMLMQPIAAFASGRHPPSRSVVLRL